MFDISRLRDNHALKPFYSCNHREVWTSCSTEENTVAPQAIWKLIFWVYGKMKRFVAYFNVSHTVMFKFCTVNYVLFMLSL